jgi:hypothetical protein
MELIPLASIVVGADQAAVLLEGWVEKTMRPR